MLSKITDVQEYQLIIELIERHLEKATELGGFSFLSEKEELNSLSRLAEKYEGNVLKIMPLPVE